MYEEMPDSRSYDWNEQASRLPPPPGRSTTKEGIMKPAMEPRIWASRSRMVWRGVRRCSILETMSHW